MGRVRPAVLAEHRTAFAAFDDYLADRVQGVDPWRALPRGRRIRLPMVDSAEDAPLDLEGALAGRRALLVFYAGGWCDASRLALTAFERARPRFEAAGTAIVGLSPQLPRYAAATIAGLGLGFPLASDHALVFTRSLGLAYKLPVELRRIVRAAGVRLPILNGEGSFDLPLPAVVLVDRGRRIRWHELAPSAAALDPAAALAALACLAAGD
jgi:peroxiredoxin